MSSTPGQVTPNEFERAVLEQFVAQHEGLTVDFAALCVLSREFTGVGCFVTLHNGISATASVTSPLGLSARIIMPGVPLGLTAVLFYRPKAPSMLEIVTWEGAHWGGDHTGFEMSRTA